MTSTSPKVLSLTSITIKVHEAGTAVLRLAPDKFWNFSAKLFEKQKDFFDVYVVNETRNDTYKRLAKIAGTVGVSEEKVYGLLEVPDKEVDGSANVGNKVTDDVKLMVKVSPYAASFRLASGSRQT